MSELCPFCRQKYEPKRTELIWVPGTPVTWGLGEKHPRAATQRLKDWKQAVGWAWRGRCPGPPRGGGIILRMLFKVRSSRKDLTNLVKAAEDGLKQVAFGDDDRVYQQITMKEPVDRFGEEGVSFSVATYDGPIFEKHHGPP